MVTYQLKLELNKAQGDTVNDWLWHLEAVWNWAVRKIELDSHDKIYHNRLMFRGLLSGHSKKIGVPAHAIQGTLSTAYDAWERCFKKLCRKPLLKGSRNRLNSILLPDPIERPTDNHIKILGLGMAKFHKQHIPNGVIKCGRIIKKASGWYLCLFIDSNPKPIPLTSEEMVGVDAGFKTLLTLSTGEKIEHPRELEKAAERLAHAQRSKNKKRVGKVHEHITNIRKERNHNLSRKLVSENKTIVFSKDSAGYLAKRFGKSVTSSSIGQLRQMLAYKCSACNRQYIEVSPKYSTMTCSNCGSRSGPKGWIGLAVRQWKCEACGAEHDRDVNAAVNTLIAGVGATHERVKQLARTEIPAYQALGGSSKAFLLMDSDI